MTHFVCKLEETPNELDRLTKKAFFFLAGVYGGSRANSCVNSRVGSRENLCEECIQNPLDLIDASIQVR